MGIRRTRDYFDASELRLQLVRNLLGWIHRSARDQGSLSGDPKLRGGPERKVHDRLNVHKMLKHLATVLIEIDNLAANPLVTISLSLFC